MVRFVLPIILIVLAITGFIVFTKPLIAEVQALRGEVASYDEALFNSKRLENERDKLTQKYNTVSPENLSKLEKLLPNSVDNIRLILEIEKVAMPYGMALQDVSYDVTTESAKDASAVVQAGAVALPERKDYGIWELSFSTQGTYSNFVNFLRDLERNLRIVDVTVIEFSAGSGPVLPGLQEVYQYSFKIKTYWLKN